MNEACGPITAPAYEADRQVLTKGGISVTVRQPSHLSLRAAARANCFEISDLELEAFTVNISRRLTSYAALAHS